MNKKILALAPLIVIMYTWGSLAAMNKKKDLRILTTAQKGDLALLELLFKDNVDLNTEYEDGWTAIIFASRNGNLGCLNFLIEHKADIHKKTKKSQANALIFAGSNGKYDCLVKLIDTCGATEINHKTRDGSTPLSFTAYNGHYDCLKLLIEHKADIYTKDVDGFTPFMHATGGGYQDCLKLLLGTHLKNVMKEKGLISYLLSLKQIKIRIPKYVTFKIFGLITTEALQTLIDEQNLDGKSPWNTKNPLSIDFFRDLEKAANTGFITIMDFLEIPKEKW